jgi:thiamine kinase-like enzyme
MIAWQDIEQALETITEVDGGFSQAHRGIVTLVNGQRVFVKVGVDDVTKKWAKKEIEVYRFLQRHGYPFIPKFLAYNDDETSFALEALDKDWDWSDTWTPERLATTLEAMDMLAAIEPTNRDKEYFSSETLNETDDGWQPLKASKELQETLVAKLCGAGYCNLADTLDITKEAERGAHFVFRHDALVHNDVRADNCAWNPKLQTVKLVDWNWTQLGDRRIDQAATLVHAHKAGLDVTKDYASRLDTDALQWMAGFWFKSAATPIWPGGPAHLRDFQLKSGVTALKLAEQL